MKKLIKSLYLWIKIDKYLPLVGVLLGITISLVVWKKTDNMYLGILEGIITSVISIIIFHIYCLDKHAYDITKQTEKIRCYDYEDLKGYSKNIDDIIELDKNFVEFLDKYSSHKKNSFYEKELNKQWSIYGSEFTLKAHNIFSKMNNPELLYSLLVTKEITHIVDIYQYFEPYTIDIDYLEKHPYKAYEYYMDNLLQQETIEKLAINEYCYNRIMNLNYFKEIEDVILSYMNNEKLIELANSSKDLEEKIKFYSYLSEDKNKAYGEYIYVSVVYDDDFVANIIDEPSYYYKTDIKDILVGDRVLVDRVGKKVEGRVIVVEYYNKDDVPYPLEKTKDIIKIIRHDEDDE